MQYRMWLSVSLLGVVLLAGCFGSSEVVPVEPDFFEDFSDRTIDGLFIVDGNQDPIWELSVEDTWQIEDGWLHRIGSEDRAIIWLYPADRMNATEDLTVTFTVKSFEFPAGDWPSVGEVHFGGAEMWDSYELSFRPGIYRMGLGPQAWIGEADHSGMSEGVEYQVEVRLNNSTNSRRLRAYLDGSLIINELVEQGDTWGSGDDVVDLYTLPDTGRLGIAGRPNTMITNIAISGSFAP